MKVRYSRAAELGLLLGPTVVGTMALLQLQLVRGSTWGPRDSLLAATVPAIGFLAHLWLSLRRPRADVALLPIALMLATLGLVTVERLRPELGARQAIWLVLGFIGLIAGDWLVSRRDWLLRYRYTAGALGLALTAATLLFGVDPNGSGARLWFSAGGISIQPVELLKVLLVVWLAGFLHEHGEVVRFASTRIGPVALPPLTYLVPLAIMFAITELLLVIQGDLGAGLLVSVVFVLMTYMATGRVSLVILGFAVLGAAGWMAHSLFSHVRLRVGIWLDPWSQSNDAGYQIVQGLIAIANGGLLGTGLGGGSPTLVPAVHTDFSIVAISEELGLVGAVGVLALYALLLHRGFRIALNHDDGYARLLAAGLATTLGVQTLLILGGVLKLLPLTGITLPWISYGGSSIVANALIVGMLLGLSNDERAMNA